ncbi:hypothetical protein LPJ57_007253, partial [Coemansia sp. RSA 486]
FQRLLGIRNVAQAAPAGNASSDSKASPFESAISKEGQTKINRDLQKNFDAAMNKRLQTQRGGPSSRGGLGF